MATSLSEVITVVILWLEGRCRNTPGNSVHPPVLLSCAVTEGKERMLHFLSPARPWTSPVGSGFWNKSWQMGLPRLALAMVIKLWLRNRSTIKNLIIFEWTRWFLFFYSFLNLLFSFSFLVMLGLEPRDSCMLSMCSVVEL